MKFLPGVRYALLAMVFLSLALVLPTVAQTTPYTVSSASFQQTCILTGAVTTADNCIAASLPFMAIGVMLSFMVIALVYMAGNVMNYQPLKNWYRKELWESIKTIILIAVIIAALVILSGVADVLVGAQTATSQQGTSALSTNLASLYNADNVYINQQLTQSYQAYAAVLGLATGVGILNSFSLSLWVPIPICTPTLPPVCTGAIQFGAIAPLLTSNFIQATPGTDAYSLTQGLTQLVVIPMLIFFQVQSSFFYYIMTLGLGVLIPLGIIFRAFPIVRDIGGTLIATGIGIALVYPALILILNLPVSNYIYAFTYSQTLSNSCPAASGLVCLLWSGLTSFLAAANPANLATGGVVTGVATNFAKFPVLVSLGTSAANNANVIGAMNSGFLVGLATPLTSGIFPTLNFIIAQCLGMILQFILVAIDLLVGLLITGAITQVLGGKVKLGIGNKLGISTR